MQREIKLDSFEDEAPRKPSPSPATTLKIWLTLYGTFAVGYAAYRMAAVFVIWAASRHLLFGFGGVFALLCIGPGVVWVYATHRRIFGSLELLAAIVGAFYYGLRLSYIKFELGVIISLTGVVFLFVKGINNVKPA